MDLNLAVRQAELDTKTKVKGRYCPVCNRYTDDEIDLEMIVEVGMCAMCDHVQVNP